MRNKTGVSFLTVGNTRSWICDLMGVKMKMPSEEYEMEPVGSIPGGVRSGPAEGRRAAYTFPSPREMTAGMGGNSLWPLRIDDALDRKKAESRLRHAGASANLNFPPKNLT